MANIVFNPANNVASRFERYGQTRRRQMWKAIWLVGFYFLNLVLYAIPLTYAGFGASGEVGSPPAIVDSVALALGTDPTATWQYLQAVIQNSTFLLLFSVLTFGTFHTAVWLTRSSNGILQSIHTVVYSTGVYLAALFSLTWYLSTASAVNVADEWLIWLQVEFVYSIIDIVGVSLELPVGRQSAVSVEGMSRSGLLGLSGLLITTIYYLYSLYLGARVNHHTTRFTAFVVIGFVIISPVVFVLGSIVVALISTDLLAVVPLQSNY
ncbi:hypothetical protein [Natronoglomus mannanivorans]|uniref:Uncharacterized protein n=1 Tax=Natronoglomus mannanivorans TaxID=2979990 RepID=A0AAP2Z1D3_9EURY|nr:hypothetical protein [Halobacteria archaeon AArc-xg1-1]